MKNIKVILSPEAEEVYSYLNKEAPTSKLEKMILKAVNKKIELVKVNYHYGQPVAKKLIPEVYKKKYGVVNLFRVELPNFWRMLYTLTDGDTKIEVVAFVLDIFDHKKYSKKFRYSK